MRKPQTKLVQPAPWTKNVAPVAAPAADQGADGVTDHGQENARDPVPLVHPAQLGIAREVLNRLVRRVVGLLRQHPAEVRPPEARLMRRVRILRRVGVAVVAAVMGGPPQRPALQRAAPQPGQDELADAGGFVGAVREVTVIAARDAEHLEEVGGGQQNQGGGGHAREESGQAGDVQPDEGNGQHPVGHAAADERSAAERAGAGRTVEEVTVLIGRSSGAQASLFAIPWRIRRSRSRNREGAWGGQGLRTAVLALRMALCLRSSARRRASHGFS